MTKSSNRIGYRQRAIGAPNPAAGAPAATGAKGLPGGGGAIACRLMRASGRAPDQLRPVSLEPGFAKHAEGSCLVRFGDTHVLCTASLEERVPAWMRGGGSGWVTAEYGMLPRATTTRTDREATRGRQSGRSQEIQRLVGRALETLAYVNSVCYKADACPCDIIPR